MRMGQGWLARQLRRFATDRDGAAALEFALVLPETVHSRFWKLVNVVVAAFKALAAA